MTYKIEFEKKAFEDFSRLDGSIKKQITKLIDKLATRDDPRSLGEPLQKSLSYFWKYRIGDYRLVAEIKDDVLIILMHDIGHRKNIYKTAQND